MDEKVMVRHAAVKATGALAFFLLALGLLDHPMISFLLMLLSVLLITSALHQRT